MFTRIQLLQHVWGYEHGCERTVDVHVAGCVARSARTCAVVTTVYGVGYRLADEARLAILPDD